MDEVLPSIRKSGEYVYSEKYNGKLNKEITAKVEEFDERPSEDMLKIVFYNILFFTINYY